MIFDAVKIEEIIGYSFKDKMLLRKCFTHPSYAGENNTGDNDCLEFFGDAIIEMVVTEYLYKTMAGGSGRLTSLRQKIVSKPPLNEMMKELGLGEFVLLGKGQSIQAKSDNKLYSDAFEALVAGIYIDGGIEEAKKFVYRTIIADFKDGKKYEEKNVISGEVKSKLQEAIQKKHLGDIEYVELAKTGFDHNPEFKMAVLLSGVKLAEGKGLSKKQAEAVAAKKALDKLIKQGKVE